MLINVCNLYEEHIEKGELIEKLDNLFKTQYINYYVGILHNKDVNDDGELKKAHYHLIVDFKDDSITCRDNLKKKTITNILQDKIDINCFYESCRSEKKATQYLIHINDKDKYQYKKSDIFTNSKERLNNALIFNKLSKDIKSDLLNKLLLTINDKVYENTLNDNNYVIFTQDYFKNNLDYYLNHYNSLNNFVRNNIFLVSEKKSIEDTDYYNCIDLLNDISDF